MKKVTVQKKLKNVDVIDVCVNNDIDSIIDKLHAIKEEFSECDKLYLDLSIEYGYYDSVEIIQTIIGTRLETDDELELRKEATRQVRVKERIRKKKLKEERVARELETYKKLKAKFEK